MLVFQKIRHNAKCKKQWPVKKTVQNGLAYIPRDPKAGPKAAKNV